MKACPASVRVKEPATISESGEWTDGEDVEREFVKPGVKGEAGAAG